MNLGHRVAIAERDRLSKENEALRLEVQRLRLLLLEASVVVDVRDRIGASPTTA